MKSAPAKFLERKAPPRRSAGDPRLGRAVTAHVEKYIGRVDWVFHDMGSDVIHLDLLWAKPGPKRNHHTIVTCGMSELAMKAPRGWSGNRHAELLLRLPSNWKIGPMHMNDEQFTWPLHELEHLGRLPHLYQTWLWLGLVSANGDPPEPICASTRFCGSILARPKWTPERFHSLRVDPGRSLEFLSVIPLYAEELLLAQDAGSAALLEKLDQAGVTDLIDANRPNLVDAPS